jgi:hypothetical protein
MSTLVKIADAVTTMLNAGGFGQTFTAERFYRPVFELKDMGVLHVSVAPHRLAIEAHDRGRDQHTYAIDIGVQKRLSTEQAPEIDALVDLVEQITDRFRHAILAIDPPAHVVKCENDPVVAAEHLENMRQFTSVVTLTIRVVR